jgi:hypothetical protein
MAAPRRRQRWAETLGRLACFALLVLGSLSLLRNSRVLDWADMLLALSGICGWGLVVARWPAAAGRSGRGVPGRRPASTLVLSACWTALAILHAWTWQHERTWGRIPHSRLFLCGLLLSLLALALTVHQGRTRPGRRPRAARRR